MCAGFLCEAASLKYKICLYGRFPLFFRKLNVKFWILIFPLVLNQDLFLNYSRLKEKQLQMRLVEQNLRIVYQVRYFLWATRQDIELLQVMEIKDIRRFIVFNDKKKLISNEDKIWVQTRVCSEVFYTETNATKT